MQNNPLRNSPLVGRDVKKPVFRLINVVDPRAGHRQPLDMSELEETTYKPMGWGEFLLCLTPLVFVAYLVCK